MLRDCECLDGPGYATKSLSSKRACPVLATSSSGLGARDFMAGRLACTPVATVPTPLPTCCEWRENSAPRSDSDTVAGTLGPVYGDLLLRSALLADIGLGLVEALQLQLRNRLTSESRLGFEGDCTTVDAASAAAAAASKRSAAASRCSTLPTEVDARECESGTGYAMAGLLSARERTMGDCGWPGGVR